MSLLQYYFYDGTLVEFTNYTIDEHGDIRSETGKMMSTRKSGEYNRCSVRACSGKRRHILVGRALASTFCGPPPTLAHTADHIDRNPDNDTLQNIRWATKSEQSLNREVPKRSNSAFIIVNGEIEMTANEWVDHLENKTKCLAYNAKMIDTYAAKKQHGYAYKVYPDLPGEVWKDVVISQGKLMISNMNRVKVTARHTENVISGERLGLLMGYPFVSFYGKNWHCHTLAFMSFFPEEYATREENDIILHEDDDRLDFRPHKLRLGTGAENSRDAHNNGKYAGKQKARVRCASYINGEFEREHESQSAATSYLRSNGHPKASHSHIRRGLDNKHKNVYGRTWVKE